MVRLTFSATDACSNVGALITITAGSGVCSVTASKAADDNYNATTSAAATIVTPRRRRRTVSLSDLDQTYNGSPKFVTRRITVPAGLTVMVTDDDEELPPTNAGSYAVWASVLDDNYEGSATGTLVIAKGDQTIDFGGLADKTFGDAAFSVSATSTSGRHSDLQCRPGGQLLSVRTDPTIGNAGSCTVTAAQAGNSNWNPAPSVNQTFTIAKAAGSVSINNIPSSAVFAVGNFTPACTHQGWRRNRLNDLADDRHLHGRCRRHRELRGSRSLHAAGIGHRGHQPPSGAGLGARASPSPRRPVPSVSPSRRAHC